MQNKPVCGFFSFAESEKVRIRHQWLNMIYFDSASFHFIVSSICGVK